MREHGRSRGAAEGINAYVSEVIANLEHGIGVRLLDRSPKGVEPTRYGQALLKRTLVVFDELKQGIRDIEHLEDPTSGEIAIASPLAIAFTVIPHVFERFVKRYPRVVLHFDEVASASATRDFRDLRDRKYDLIVGRGGPPQPEELSVVDLTVETLFDDQLVIAAGLGTSGSPVAARSTLRNSWTSLGSCRHHIHGIIGFCRTLAAHAVLPCLGPAW